MPRGWTSGPNGELLPVSTSERAVHIMKIATGEIEESRGLARARPGAVPVPVAVGVEEDDDEMPRHPMYGPGLPPPGGWGDEQAADDSDQP